MSLDIGGRIALTAGFVCHRAHLARERARPAHRKPLPDVVTAWESNGHRYELRAPRLEDFGQWRAARLNNQAQMDLVWDAQDGSWEFRHQLADWVRVVAAARRGRRRRTSLASVIVADAVVIGQVNLERIDEAAGVAEAGVWVDPSNAGAGIGCGAVARIVKFTFAELSVDRLIAPISVGNIGASLVAQRVGFRREGVMHDYADTGGRHRDHTLWAIARKHYAQKLTGPDSSSGTQSFVQSNAAQARLHDLVPGGAHTYARGEDQYPDGMAPVIARGIGCRVWDVDGNEFIEYGAGLRAVTLGHAFPPVIDAIGAALADGNNFSRPSALELAAAESFLATVTTAEMVKFAKNGSDVTSAALRLARAVTGRTTVAICEQPFFSVDDWFIGTTPMDSGTRETDVVRFTYNDLGSLREALSDNAVAAVFMEAATALAEPDPGFLEGVRRLCDEHGALLVFDEMITGFRWAAGGAQSVYDVTPDLSCWGKALGNGFPIAALAGKRDLMEAGGLRAPGRRVFLLSTTQGPESVGLAAMCAVLDVYRTTDPVSVMQSRGSRLADGINALSADHGLSDHFFVTGRPSCEIFVTRDVEGHPSQEFRTLAMQELITRGILGQSLVVSAAHSRSDIDRTVAAFGEVMDLYRQAIDAGSAQPFLSGRPVAPAIREHAAPRTPYSTLRMDQ